MTIHRITTHQTQAATPGVEFRLAPETAFVLCGDGSARLLDMAGSFFALNESAAHLLDAALRLPVVEAAREMAARTRTDEAEVARDLQQFLGELERKRVIVRNNGYARRHFVRERLGALVMRPILFAALRFPGSLRFRARILFGLAFIFLRLFGWMPVLAAWRRSSEGSSRSRATSEAAEAVETAVRSAAAASWCHVECKEVALCGWGLLRRLGVRPHLNIGIELYPFAGHAWCETSGRVFADLPGRCARYTPLWRYA